MLTSKVIINKSKYVLDDVLNEQYYQSHHVMLMSNIVLESKVLFHT